MLNIKKLLDTGANGCTQSMYRLGSHTLQTTFLNLFCLERFYVYFINPHLLEEFRHGKVKNDFAGREFSTQIICRTVFFKKTVNYIFYFPKTSFGYKVVWNFKKLRFCQKLGPMYTIFRLEPHTISTIVFPFIMFS